ncbi:unnamed protein product, partial [Mesorhabditis belari]|uniref:Uncharacterized protein n=1 Tax=Mesorhabditis belari TaxID=2138241 RepID=A0AAF3F7J7_9BILA
MRCTFELGVQRRNVMAKATKANTKNRIELCTKMLNASKDSVPVKEIVNEVFKDEMLWSKPLKQSNRYSYGNEKARPLATRKQKTESNCVRRG